MADRAELLEAALDSLPEGIAVVGPGGDVAFWNGAAEAITGCPALELVGRPVSDWLDALLASGAPSDGQPEPGRRNLVHIRHRLGHDVPVIVRTLPLRDGLGESIGAAAVFHPAETLDALPHGRGGPAEASQEQLEERLQMEFDDFTRGGPAIGLLWIGVDQAPCLRKTHGAVACEAMLQKVEQALRQGLRPTDEIARWGEEEFLVLCHERTAPMLSAHARNLAGQARTADFRWWGDRVSITISIGAAQAQPGSDESLAQLLDSARRAMAASASAGGNGVTPEPEAAPCLQS